MAVAYEMRFRGATLGQYDQVIEKMGLTGDAPAPPGALFHWVAQTDDGILVVDVWESEEVFDRFAAEQIVPFTQEAGIAQPEVTKHQVYNHLSR
jgi:hypothetical protein